jgi:hypothetical protein
MQPDTPILTQQAGTLAKSQNRVLRNTYLLLALTMVPTVLGAIIGVQLNFAFFAGNPAEPQAWTDAIARARDVTQNHPLPRPDAEIVRVPGRTTRHVFGTRNEEATATQGRNNQSYRLGSLLRSASATCRQQCITW